MKQYRLNLLGSIVQANSTRLFIGLTIGLLVLCVAIKSAKLDAELSSWIQRTSRIDSELNYVSSAIGEGTGSTSQLLIQTPRNQRADILTVDSFMIHLEAMAIATHVSVDLYDVSWSLRDLCFKPTLPDYEELHVITMLDNMMPCAIKTPLDCFWEGAKLLGPEQPVRLSSIGPMFKWTSLNPMFIVEGMQRAHPHASFPYVSLLDWMHRVGITSGYQHKPCLDPTDPNCPDTAPNKLSGKAPNIGAQLTGGCRGLAVKQMHWKEEEIVGGLIRNKSGHIVRASALQSTIQLMGEQDMYDYWRKTSKVQDINNWSAEKAKLVLDSWQRRFKEELAQFTRASISSKSYKIHEMTSKSMLEPLEVHSLLELTNFELCFALMTIFTCIAYPNFSLSNETPSKDSCQKEKLTADRVNIDRFKTILLAIVTSSFVGLTFIASLGLSSFMNLPFNMATTQILPPLALYYGFNQFIMIANIYSQKFGSVPMDNLTTECLNELFPIITIESLSYIIALLVATIIPVPATRVFALQAITYIILSTFAGIVLMPSIMTTFLLHLSPKSLHKSQNHISISGGVRPGSSSSFKISSKKGAKQTQSDDFDLEDQIFSRLQDDLKNIQADTRHPTNINFSAHLGTGGLHTSFRLTTSQSSRHDGSSTHIAKSLSSDETNKYDAKPPGYDQLMNPRLLPDLITSALPTKSANILTIDDCNISSKTNAMESEPDIDESSRTKQKEDRPTDKTNLFKIYANSLTDNKLVQIALCFLNLCILAAMLSEAPKVKYGLQLRDIVAQGTEEYESFLVQEKYFPVYNVFVVTKGNIDYPANQRLLYQFYKALEQVDGIVGDEDGSLSKFWLANFRDWLLEIQQKFDVDRNKSAISSEGWTSEASDAAKLAYKLLAQTGKVDNPIDKSQVETNRLVDTNGIINPRAFYYYLTAWVVNDAFTYATSEANFKPEPKVWNGNPDDLKIEKARPLTYAQIPLLMKLPANHDSLKTISEIRSISQAFEQLNLPNFPTGIPFIFWDQFINLDLLFFISVAIGIVSIFIIIGLTTSDFSIAAIITIPILLTLLELYCFMGHISVTFNNILAVLLISTIGITTVQTVHYATYFGVKEGDLVTRTSEALRSRTRIVITSLLLFFICVLVFHYSNIDFMVKYSCLLLCLAIINSFNSLLLAPVILSLFGSRYKPFSCRDNEYRSVESPKKVYHCREKSKHRVRKKTYPRVQSEISLSTISEESQSVAHGHDLKFDLSIRCY